MKRIFALSVASLCLLLLVPGAPVPLAGSEPPPSMIGTPTGSALPWERVDEGVDVIRLSEHLTTGMKSEAVLLRLTDARHKELNDLEEEFLNRYTGKIFSKGINGMTPCTGQIRDGGPSDRTGLYWYAMMPHWPDSNCLCLSYLDWMPEIPTE